MIDLYFLDKKRMKSNEFMKATCKLSPAFNSVSQICTQFDDAYVFVNWQMESIKWKFLNYLCQLVYHFHCCKRKNSTSLEGFFACRLGVCVYLP